MSSILEINNVCVLVCLLRSTPINPSNCQGYNNQTHLRREAGVRKEAWDVFQ